MTQFQEWMETLTDPQEKLAAFLTGAICGACRCSRERRYINPDLRGDCECYQEAGRIIEMLRPMLKTEPT